MNVFAVRGTNGKELFLSCAAGDLNVQVGVDDVDHYETAMLLRKMLAVLNDHWNDSEYAGLDPAPPVTAHANDDAESAYWDKRYEDGKRLLSDLMADAGKGGEEE